MDRRTRDERKKQVLDAAAEEIWSAAVEWASSLTFGALANTTGIDQAQIARDFGSKEQLVDGLIEHLLDPAAYQHHLEHVSEWVDSVPAMPTRLDEIFNTWAAGNDDLNRGNLNQLRSQMMLWAAAEDGSPEWTHLARVYRSLVDHHTEEATEMVGLALQMGAVERHEISVREAVIIMTAVVEGLMIRASVDPDLVPPGLTAKAVKAVIAGSVGPDDIGPSEQLAQIGI